jgi:hypothetical protein
MARPATGSTSPSALDLAPGIPPWEKQPGETAEAYHRFLQYLDVDPLLRSKNRMATVHEALADRDPGVCSVAALQNMATLNHWHIRAEAHDRHKRRQADLAAERAEKEWAETVARRSAEVRLKHLDAAAEVIQKGLYALAIKDPADISATDAIRMVDTGVRIEKETLGLSGKQAAGPQEAGHVHDLSDDQTAARLRQLADELARRINDQNKSGNAAAAPDVMDAEVIPHRDSSDDDPPQEPRRGTRGEPEHLAIEAARPD